MSMSLVIAAFLCALVYVGAQYNLIFLAFSASLLFMAALPSVGRREVSSPAWIFVTLAALALTSSQLFSLSPDSSFSALWGPALGLMAFLAGARSGVFLRMAWRAVVFVVLLLALRSVWALVLDGQRPGWPMTDQNNYASLLYLAFIPLLHEHLVASWTRSPSRYPRLAPLVSLVGTLVILASGSRVGLAVWLGCGGLWLTLAWVRGLSVRPVLTIFAVGAAGALVHLWLSPEPIAAVGEADTIAGGSRCGGRCCRLRCQWFPACAHGHRLLCFPLLYRQVRSDLDAESAGLFVHNDYVQFLLEGGPVLAFVLVIAGAWTFYRFVRALSAPLDSARFVSLGCLAALGALFAHALVNFVFYTPVLSLLAGFMAGLVAGADASRSPANARTQWLSYLSSWSLRAGLHFFGSMSRRESFSSVSRACHGWFPRRLIRIARLTLPALPTV
ncbi:MAG: hypothetical protein R3E84_07280 [Pseudomonadales bacterium]